MKHFLYSYESAITAFDDFANIVVKLEGFGLSAPDSKMLQKSIASSLSYIKNYFPYSIKWHSDVRSHCAQWALSDQQNQLFRTDCDEEHSEECSFCNDIPKIRYSLIEAVKLLEENSAMTEKDGKKLVYGIKQADEAIRHYKNHLLKAHCQNETWAEMQNKQPTDTVFIHIDYPMNFIPTENRESQQNWFGKEVIIVKNVL